VWVLAENDIITDETAVTLTDAVGFGNVLTYQSGTIDSERVYDYLQELRAEYRKNSMYTSRSADRSRAGSNRNMRPGYRLSDQS
jgi:uncharacterized protein YutE (UPF0331/DUF86 family)